MIATHLSVAASDPHFCVQSRSWLVEARSWPTSLKAMAPHVSQAKRKAHSTAALDTCKYCKRSRNHPNPMPNKYPQETHLPMVPSRPAALGSGTLKCRPCHNYLQTCWKLKSHDELQTELARNEENQQMYNVGLHEYEQLVENNNGRAPKGGVEQLRFEESVFASSEVKFRMEAPLGVWWPVKMWEGKFQRTAEATCIHELEMDDGVRVPGVVADETHGCPTGCVKLAKEWSTRVERNTVIEGTAPELRSGQKKDSFHQARTQFAGISVVPQEAACAANGDALHFNIHKGSKLEARPSDSDASIDYLDLRISASRERAATPPATKRTDRAEHTPSTETVATPKNRQARPPKCAGTNSPAARTSPSVKKSEAAAFAQLKEQQNCRVLCGQAQELLAMCRSAEVLTVGESVIAATINKLDTRLQQKSMQHLVANRPGHVLATSQGNVKSDTLQNTGIELVSDLQLVRTHLDVVRGMVQVLHNQKLTATASMQKLVKQRMLSKEKNFTFDVAVDMEIIRKIGEVMLMEKRWMEYASLCRCQEEEAVTGIRHPVGIWMLPVPLRSTEQAKRIQEDIITRLRLDDTTANLTCMVRALSDVAITDTAISAAMGRLRVMVDASTDSDEKALKEAQTFFALPDSPLHKVITVLPLGQLLLKNVSLALDMITQDSRAAAACDSIAASLDVQLGSPTAATLEAISSFLQPCVTTHAGVQSLLCGTSAQFQHKQSQLLQEAEGFMSTAIQTVEITLHKEFHCVLQQCITVLVTLLQQEDPFDESRIKLQAALGQLTGEPCNLAKAEANHIGVSKLMTAEQKKLWNDRSLDVRHMIEDYIKLFEFLSAASWTAEKTLAGVVWASFHRSEMVRWPALLVTHISFIQRNSSDEASKNLLCEALRTFRQTLANTVVQYIVTATISSERSALAWMCQMVKSSAAWTADVIRETLATVPASVAELIAVKNKCVVAAESYVEFADTEAVKLADDWSIDALCCVPCLYETFVAQLETEDMTVDLDLCVTAITKAQAFRKMFLATSKTIKGYAGKGECLLVMKFQSYFDTNRDLPFSQLRTVIQKCEAVLQEFINEVKTIMNDPALPKTLEYLRDADKLDDAVGMKLLEMTQSRPDKRLWRRKMAWLSTVRGCPDAMCRVLDDVDMKAHVRAVACDCATAMRPVLERVAVNIAITACFQTTAHSVTRHSLLVRGQTELKGMQIDLSTVSAKLHLTLSQMCMEHGVAKPDIGASTAPQTATLGSEA